MVHIGISVEPLNFFVCPHFKQSDLYKYNSRVTINKFERQDLKSCMFSKIRLKVDMFVVVRRTFKFCNRNINLWGLVKILQHFW
jgi:hypothetical protein